MFLGHASVKHLTSATAAAESSRVGPQKRILLPVLDDLQDNCYDGKRPGSPRTLRHPRRRRILWLGCGRMFDKDPDLADNFHL